MQILLHLGLNKCASTYIQRTMERAHAQLAAAGVWYPWHSGQTAHYGLSKHYGFGPMNPEISPVSLGDVISEARLAGCDRMVLSSEYLSLFAPRAAARLIGEAQDADAEIRCVLIGRALEPWIRSLFNQYVKTVDGGRPLANIDAFAEQVLANGAINLAARVGQWQDLVGPEALCLHRMDEAAPLASVMAPFSAFAGISLGGTALSRENPSLDADRLHAIGLLRQQAPNPVRNRALTILLAGRGRPDPAPDGFLELSPGMRQRLTAEIATAADHLPWQPLLKPVPTRAAA